MAEVLLPRKMEISNDPSKFRSPDLLHVLAVDDSHVDRKFIERLLKVSSCKVTVVDSATRALQYLGLDADEKSIGFKDLKVNLIMTDYSMPGMTGYELLKKIKESSAFRDIPVVVMSSENILPRIDRSKPKQALTNSITDSTTTSVSATKPREVKATMISDPKPGIGLIIHPTINPKKTYDPGGIITHGEEIMEPRRSNKAYELILAQVETKVKTSSSAHHQHATKKSHPQKMTQEEDTKKELTICSITTSSGSSIGTSSADLPYMEAFTFGRSIQHQTFTYQNYSVLSSFPSSLDVLSCTRPHKILHNFNKSHLEKKEIKPQRLLSKNESHELFVNQAVPRILTYPLKPSRYKETIKSLDPCQNQPNG